MALPIEHPLFGEALKNHRAYAIFEEIKRDLASYEARQPFELRAFGLLAPRSGFNGGNHVCNRDGDHPVRWSPSANEPNPSDENGCGRDGSPNGRPSERWDQPANQAARKCQGDEATIRSSYLALIEHTGKLVQTTPQRQPDRVNDIQGKPATTSMWELKGAERSIMFAITTYPEPKFMIQHLMTVSYVR